MQQQTMTKTEQNTRLKYKHERGDKTQLGRETWIGCDTLGGGVRQNDMTRHR